MPEVKSMRLKISFVEERTLLGTRAKKEPVSKQNKATREDYRSAVRVCRKSTVKAKAQLELKLTSSVSDNKKVC